MNRQAAIIESESTYINKLFKVTTQSVCHVVHELIKLDTSHNRLTRGDVTLVKQIL